MSFKQLFFRYLKQTGKYGVISNYGYCQSLKYFDINNPCYLLEFVESVFFANNVKWFYTGDKRYLFFKDWAGNKYEVKKGDIVYVKTLDGKYICKFTVRDIWVSDMTFFTDKGNKISLDRIVNINGKYVDYKNGWYFKKNIQLKNEQ